jgi:hypothetical protein
MSPLAKKAERAQESMTKGEREDLQRLIRQREKVLKSAAKQRSAELLAEFENQMGSEYAFDCDEVWERAVKAIEPLVRKAKAQIATRCRELGIPQMFAPDLDLQWQSRNYHSATKERQTELREMATTRIEAIEAKAIVEIEMQSVAAQTEIATYGLTSSTAKTFLDRLPSIERLMPALSYAEIAGEADPPVVEQLVSPNALRQRRFREKQAALRNASEALQAPSRNANDDDEDENDR